MNTDWTDGADNTDRSGGSDTAFSHEPGRSFVVRAAREVSVFKVTEPSPSRSRPRHGYYCGRVVEPRRAGGTASSGRPEPTASGRHPERRAHADAFHAWDAWDLLLAQSSVPRPTSRDFFFFTAAPDATRGITRSFPKAHERFVQARAATAPEPDRGVIQAIR